MSYPIQSLVIIAPILFMVLIIVVPVIGVFAGWKRAAYWGGGTFFFFLVGMIVWKAAGVSIAGKLSSLITSLLPKGATVTPQLIQSIAAPIFFIAVMMVAELILLINYYAWFKRVAKIKQDIKLKKQIKAAKKAGTKAPAISGSGWTQMQFTNKGKIINMVGGGVGLGLLLAPSTVTFTQAIYYLTTDSATRAANKFASGLYGLLQDTGEAFSWMSYYNGKTAGKDCDSLFSTLHMLTTKVTSYWTIDDDGNAVQKTGVSKTGVDVMTDVIQKGFTVVMTKSTTSASTKQEKDAKQANITKAITGFATSWNKLQDSAGTALTAIFQSESVAQTIEGIVKTQVTSSTTLDENAIKAAFGDDSEFKKMYEKYVNKDIPNLTPIKVSTTTFNTLTNMVKSFVKPAETVTDPNTLQMFNDNIQFVVGMMFQC